jgi:hypothetical protein
MGNGTSELDWQANTLENAAVGPFRGCSGALSLEEWPGWRRERTLWPVKARSTVLRDEAQDMCKCVCEHVCVNMSVCVCLCVYCVYVVFIYCLYVYCAYPWYQHTLSYACTARRRRGWSCRTVVRYACLRIPMRPNRIHGGPGDCTHGTPVRIKSAAD